MVDFYTLDSAKKHLRNNWEDGISCPCCGQFVKRYRRKINSMIAWMLINLYKKWLDDGGYIHVGKLIPKQKISSGRDFAILRYWGLIQEKPNTDSEKRNSGYWRITDKGVEFVIDQIKVSSHCFLYNGKALGFSDEKISIKEALGNKFNYAELMNYSRRVIHG